MTMSFPITKYVPKVFYSFPSPRPILPKYPSQMGDLFTGIASLVVSAGAVGINAYTAIEQMDLAKEQSALMSDLARQKAALEAEVIQAQQRLLEVQTQGIEGRQSIDLEIAQAEADAAQRRLARVEELEIMQTELAKVGYTIDYTKLMGELDAIKQEQEQAKLTAQIAAANLATTQTNIPTASNPSTTTEIAQLSNASQSLTQSLNFGTVATVVGVAAALLLLFQVVRSKKVWT